MLGNPCKLYPTKTQLSKIRQTAGCCRYVYNYFLDRKISYYKETGKTLSDSACDKELTQLKKEPDKLWLKDVSIRALQQSIKDLGNAYNGFFKEHKGFPNFHSKAGKQSFRVYYPVIKGNKIKIDKIGYVKVRGLKQLDRYESYTLQSATVTVSPDDYCEISILIKDEILKNQKVLAKTDVSVGCDLGIHALLTLSDGTKIYKPDILNSLYRKREYYQSKRDNARKGSKNRQKWIKKQWSVSRKIQHIEDGFVKNIGYLFAEKYDNVFMEDLDVKNMFTDEKSNPINARINKSIIRSCMSTVKSSIKYFCEKYGKNFTLVNRFYPSSQICSKCGYQNPDVKDLTIREWECPSCHTKHDRDVNAAINLLNWKNNSVV